MNIKMNSSKIVDISKIKEIKINNKSFYFKWTFSGWRQLNQEEEKKINGTS